MNTHAANVAVAGLQQGHSRCRSNTSAVRTSARIGSRPHCALTDPTVWDRLPSSTPIAGAIAGSAPLPPLAPRACPTRSRHRHPTGRWHRGAFSAVILVILHARPAGHDPTYIGVLLWPLRAADNRSAIDIDTLARRTVYAAVGRSRGGTRRVRPIAS